MPRVGGGEGGKAGGERVRVLWEQQPGLVWTRKAIAHSLPCGGEGHRMRCWRGQAYHPHSRCFEC